MAVAHRTGSVMKKNRYTRTRPLSRKNALVEACENRLLFAFTGESNNTLATASYDSSNVYLEQNASISDSVSTSADGDDYYKFYNLYGTSHLYASLFGMSADADVYVYNQAGSLLASSTLGGNASETINVNLPFREYVYVRVHAASGATNYTLNLYNDYAGSTTGTARDQGVSLGQTNDQFKAFGQVFINDYLDYRDNVDYFRFTLEAPATVNLRRLAPNSTGPVALQTDMVLYNASGSVLRNATPNGSGIDIQNVKLAAGSYFVGVRQLQGAGSYSLRLVSDYAGSTPATSRYLGNLTNQSSQMIDMVCGPFGFPAYDDALDVYKFDLTAPAGRSTVPVTIALDMTGQDTSQFEANFWVARDANNDGVIADSEKLNTLANVGNDKIAYTGLASGTYYVGVYPPKNYTTYTLDIDSDLDGLSGNYKSLSGAQDFGSITSATTKSFAGGFGVSQGDTTDFYKFTLPTQTTVQATVNRSANSREFWTPGLFFIKDGNNNGLADGTSEILANSGSGALTFTLPAGTYYLDLASTGGGQLNYTGKLTFTPTAPATDPDDTISKVVNRAANLLATGGNVQFSLDNLKDVDLIKYVATAGQTIGFDIDGRNGTTPNTYLKLFSSSGTVLASNDNQLAPNETGSTVSSYIRYTFATAGTYYLGVSLSGNTAYSPTAGTGDVNGAGPTGDYTLNAIKLAKVTGLAWKDTDKDGVKDAGEGVFSGVTIWADFDGDGVKDSDEYSVTTDTSGNYTLYVPAGTWKIRAVKPTGYNQTSPASNGPQTLTLTAGQSISGKNFGLVKI